MLVEKFDEARLLWDTKGWTIEGLADEIAEQIEAGKRPGLKEFALSTTSLQRASITSRYVPKPLAELIEELKPIHGREHATEIVESGLRLIRGQPPASKQEPQEIARELLAQFPADAVAKKLADELAGLAKATGESSLLHVFSRAVAERLPRVRPLRATKVARVVTANLSHTLDRLDTAGANFEALANKSHGLASAMAAKLDSHGDKVDALQATANHTNATVELLDAKLELSERHVW